MKCPRCQHENPPQAKFCEECATPLARICQNCGTQLSATAKFCPQCAHPVVGPAAPQPRFASPEAYTPKHLAEKILTSRSALEGERKQVTVLFADVSGFTSISEQLDPEEVHGFMTRVFELMLAEVHRFEGTVNQFLGDGIMALFGAPIAHEDHAHRAVHAALGIRQALEAYQDELRGKRGINFQVRQGLNTGLVVVGSIGSDLRMDYTAVGDTTNVAARLQQAADPRHIVISDATHRFVQGFFYTRPLGDLTLKGKAEPVRAWEVISARVARTRLEVEVERGLTPFMGRERELRLLLDCFEKAQAGQGQVAFLVGEAGIGKSRLLLEFRRRLRDEATWLEGHSISFGQSIAFHPLIDLLRRNFRIEEKDSEPVIIEKIERGALRLGEDLRPILPYLRFLLSVNPGDPALTSMDPRQRRRETFDAVRRLTLRACEIRPQVVIFEDGHWMDKATEDYLVFLADSVPTSRLLFILTYRPGYTHPLGEKTYHTRIALDRLSNEASALMIQALLATEELPPELKPLIASKAEGNPLFVEEVLKSLLEVRALHRVHDRYVLARPLDAIAVPDTIHDLIMARIDRLPDAPKRTLQLASVIGREFTRRLLDRIAEIRERTEDALQALKGIELVYEKALFPELAYMFKHALTHEVAYNSLLIQRRKELHHLVGLGIEELYADRLPEHYEVLAHHFSKGEDPAKALKYLLKAGDKAAQAFANREAMSLYEQALPRVSDHDLARRAEILQKLSNVAYYVNADACLRYAESALRIYEDLRDKPNTITMHMRIVSLYTGGYWDGAREDKAMSHVQTAAALVESDPDSSEKAHVYVMLAHLHCHRSEPATTLTWSQRVGEVLKRLGDPPHYTRHWPLATALAYTGRINEGTASNEWLWRAVLETGEPIYIAAVGHEVSLALGLLRDVRTAREWGEKVLAEITRRTKGNPVFEAFARRPLTLIYTLAGDTEKADEARQAVEKIESRTMLGCVFEDGAAVGLYHLRRGDWDTASEVLKKRLAVYQERNNLAPVSACALMLGKLRLEQGNYSEAEELLSKSLRMCRGGGNVLLELWVLPVLAELYLVTGHPARAEESISSGFELLTPDQTWYGLPAPLHTARGRLATALRQWDEAERSFDQAVAVNRRCQLPWDEADALHAWGLMHVSRAQAGDDAKAHEKLDMARGIFDRVGAKKDAEKVRATTLRL